jgi:hypothetical protein
VQRQLRGLQKTSFAPPSFSWDDPIAEIKKDAGSSFGKQNEGIKQKDKCSPRSQGQQEPGKPRMSWHM